jgi:hypothetical protein
VSRWFLKSTSISFNHINYRNLNYMSSHNKFFLYHSKNDWRSLYVELKELRSLRAKRIWSSLTSLRKRRRWKWKCLWIKSTILRMFWIWSIHMNKNTSLMMILSLLILHFFFIRSIYHHYWDYWWKIWQWFIQWWKTIQAVDSKWKVEWKHQNEKEEKNIEREEWKLNERERRKRRRREEKKRKNVEERMTRRISKKSRLDWSFFFRLAY